jgi:hypothetical protein
MVESSAASHEPEQGQDPPSPPAFGEGGPGTEPAPATEPVADPAPQAAGEPEPEAQASVEPPATAQPAPEPEVQPTPVVEPTAVVESTPVVEPTADPAVASSLSIPASEDSAASDGGGEWELLRGKLRDWFSQGDIQQLLHQYAGPLKLLAGFVGLLLLLRIYAALLGAIESLPLLPGLLELAGVIWLGRFGLTRLVRSSDRQALLASWRQRWAAFRGQP